jgi:Lrp/AsnC family leucine-responsive transcriptional regulator
MDEIDRKIIGLLQQDGRLAQTAVAASVGLSLSAVNERVRRLTETGALSFRGIADPEAAGLEVLAFIMILLGHPQDDAPFRQAMQAVPEVLEVHHVTGDWSYLLKVRTRTNRALESLISSKIKAVPGVQRSQTLIALSSPKETTLLPLEA